MKTRKLFGVTLCAILFVFASACSEVSVTVDTDSEANTAPAEQAQDVLPSWNDGRSRKAIVRFVSEASDETSEGFIPVDDRIAVFDNDGTLWSEQPLYFQIFFALDRLKEMSAADPTIADAEPFRTALTASPEEILGLGTENLLKLVAKTHSGQSNAEFYEAVLHWVATATHPGSGKPYPAMVYQPMLELLDYLRANEFRVYIVTGGGIEFVRAWADGVYGIPPDHVVGSSFELSYEAGENGPRLQRHPKIGFINDGPGKPVGIQMAIGQRPRMAFGNSNGDLQMLQWTVAGEGPSFAGIVHHTDSEREWAYDRDSHIGRLDKALDEAKQNGWTVVDMKTEWKVIYP